jgi:hypothetical protein
METIIASLIAAAGGGKSANLQAITINRNNSRHIAGQAPYEGIDGWNDITVDVPEKDEIEGWFSENGDYSPATGKVWNLIHINVPQKDYKMPPNKTSSEVEEFTQDDPPIWKDVELTWQVVRVPQDGQPHSYTFGNRTITAYMGVIVYTWANGEPFVMSDAIWSFYDRTYQTNSIGDFVITPASGSNPPTFEWTLNYSRGGIDNTTTKTVTLRKNNVNLNVEAMSDGDGWAVSNS